MAGRKFHIKIISFCQFLVPGAIFILTVYLVLSLEYPLGKYSDWLLYMSRLDPLNLLAYFSAVGTMPAWGGLPVLVLVLTVFFGRVFCGWICPVGGMLGILERIRRVFSVRIKDAPSIFLPPALFRLFSRLRYFWLAVVVMFFTVGSSLLLVFTPFALISHEVTRIYFGQKPWLLVCAVLLGLFFSPRFWCLYICPSGILFSMAAKVKPDRLRPSGGCRYSGGFAAHDLNADCSLCLKVCPVRKANEAWGNYRPSRPDCLSCGQCWAVCPNAIIKWGKKSNLSNQDKKGRREFILAVTGMTALLLSSFSPRLLSAAKTAPQPLRPPGAIPEEDFLASCNRCQRCVKVCPSECLVPMPLEAGLVFFETPRFVPRKGRCELCMLCPKVCASGALKDVDAEDVLLGRAVIDKNICLAWDSGKLCLVCAEQCPVQAVVIDDDGKPSIDLEKCIGCGACENSCPTDEAAVVVEPIAGKP